MPLITRRQILENQFNDFYPALEISKLVLEALKKLPPDLQEEMTIEGRIEELKRDIKVLKVRVEIIKRELENEQKKQGTD